MGVTFLTTLAAGMMGLLAVCPVRQIAWRYLRTATTIALALQALASAWLIMAPSPLSAGNRWPAMVLLGMGAAATVAAAALSPAAEPRPGPFRVASAVAGATELAMALWWGRLDGLWPRSGQAFLWTAMVGQTLGALVLGSVTLAWLLGHAYLTATHMSIAPLRRLSDFFLLAVVVRTSFVVLALGTVWAGLAGDAAAPLGRLASQWIISSLRFSVGLIVLGVFAYMVRDCVRVRNTQSATGILYFASVTAYVGELSNQYLVQQTGLGF